MKARLLVRAVALTVVLATSAFSLSQVDSGSVKSPIALDSLPSLGLFILDTSGTVYRMNYSDSNHSASSILRITSSEYAVDLTLAQFQGKIYLFVSSNVTSGAENGGRISQYDLTGKLVYKWIVPGIVSTIDYDPDHTHLYFTTPADNKLFRIDIKTRPGHIGPIGYDRTAGNIYIADGGKILIMDGATKHIATGFNGQGEIGSIRVDDDGSLYVTDVRRRTVEQLRPLLSSRGIRLETVRVVATDLGRPTAVATMSKGRIAVSDSQENTVSIFDERGNRLYTVRLAN
jgi:DNA-binding beta-propeller fold protein YncE